MGLRAEVLKLFDIHSWVFFSFFVFLFIFPNSSIETWCVSTGIRVAFLCISIIMGNSNQQQRLDQMDKIWRGWRRSLQRRGLLGNKYRPCLGHYVGWIDKAQTMQFLWQGQKAILVGDPSLKKSKISLKAMIKALRSEGGGILVE